MEGVCAAFLWSKSVSSEYPLYRFIAQHAQSYETVNVLLAFSSVVQRGMLGIALAGQQEYNLHFTRCQCPLHARWTAPGSAQVSDGNARVA